MRNSDRTDEDWAMSERRERAVMRDVPEIGRPPVLPAAEDFKVPTARGILSKDEIQALLRPNLPAINDSDGESSFDRQLDDRRFEDRADGRRLAARLSRAFGQFAGLKAALSLQAARRFETTRAAFGGTGEKPGTAYITFGRRDGDVSHILCLSAALCDCLVANACGAANPGKHAGEARALSVIDCALIEQFLAPFSSILGEDLSFIGIETDRRYAQSLLAADAGRAFDFEVVARDLVCAASLLAVEPGADVVSARAALPAAEPAQRPVTAVLTARIASLSVPVSRVSRLKAGDTLLLGLPSDQPVQLLSGGRDGTPAFEGNVGRQGDRMAVRIRRAV